MSKKEAFILMPFAEEFSDVYEHLIVACLSEIGYEVKRADDMKSQNNIISDIIQGISTSDLIVSDLTGSNPNVYYELGIAHALNKKVILITQEIDELPFDLRSYRVIGYGTHFSKMNQARKELADLAAEAYKGTLPFGNPVNDFGIKALENTHNLIVGTTGEISNEADDLGLIDYRVMLEDGFESMAEIVGEVGGKLELELTPEIETTGEKLNSGDLSTKQQRNAIRGLAENVQDYGAFLKPKNEKYRAVLKSVETALENILSGNFELGEDEEEGLSSFLETLQGLEKSVFEGRQGFVGLVDVMENLPKIEKNFNRSKIFMVSELKTFIDNIDQTLSVISRAGVLGDSLIETAHNNQSQGDA